MGRLRKRSTSVEQASPCLGSGVFCTSHLEPPSPEDDTPHNARLGVASFSAIWPYFGLWPTTYAPTFFRRDFKQTRAKHIPIDISKYLVTNIPTVLDVDYGSPISAHSPRIRRHIPIIIPDFAQPFAPDSPPLSHHSSQGTLSPRRLTPETRILATTDATVKAAFKTATFIEKNQETSINESPFDMEISQTSLSGQDIVLEAGHVDPPPAAPASGLAGISPVINQQGAGSAATNLSGLVCNVHRTTGKEPHALVGATTTILGDKLYVFGGRIHSRNRPQLTSDLYELDLIRRHWSKIDTTGDVPPPRYFHSICALGDTKLVCYGGMSPSTHVRNQSNGKNTASQNAKDSQPEVGVMSDIHVLDVPSRTWTLLRTTDNPQGRYAHCATILPSSAVFSSASAPLSAIQHNPSSSDPHSGKLGVQLDGSGGAEMVVVGGQDSANNYIEQISVFNLRSLKWTTNTPWDRKCGAYKSMVAPLPASVEASLGKGGGVQQDTTNPGSTDKGDPSSMLIYSNYNFLEVKLELQIRSADGNLREVPMAGNISPPGLRFPNGGITDNHFVVSGTYLTSSKHEYALWALDLRTLTWGRIDTNGTVFGQGSWNRGVLWNRRNTFVILGHRKRSLVDDYNHRRINFSHICMVELEAFGLYDNPRTLTPNSAYVSISSPSVPASMQASLPTHSAGGRLFSNAATKLGQAVLSISEMADMELVAQRGERIPCNSQLLSRRWGPYFNQLLVESASPHENASISDAATLRPTMNSQASRNSSITITPSIQSNATTVTAGLDGRYSESVRTASRATTRTLELPNTSTIPTSSRPRSLYLPHMVETIQLMLHYLYTSSLPPVGSVLCAPHILCSLLQMARTYQIDGLLEATVERLHEVLDGRNAAAVFNAAAMAAGGGRGLGQASGGTLDILERRESGSKSGDEEDKENAITRIVSAKTAGLRIDTTFNPEANGRRGHEKTDSIDSASTATSASTDTDFSMTDPDSSTRSGSGERASRNDKEDKGIWTGDVSTVIGLQKRGLRGLMEGRRLRERGNTLLTNSEQIVP